MHFAAHLFARKIGLTSRMRESRDMLRAFEKLIGKSKVFYATSNFLFLIKKQTASSYLKPFQRVEQRRTARFRRFRLRRAYRQSSQRMDLGAICADASQVHSLARHYRTNLFHMRCCPLARLWAGQGSSACHASLPRWRKISPIG